MPKRADGFTEVNPQAELVNNAWIGDAVLLLWARLKILNDDGRLDGEKSIRMTSNRFLAAIGEPTKVEAEIGKVYLRNGESAAFQFIEQQILPVFERQEKNRAAKGPAKRKS